MPLPPPIQGKRSEIERPLFQPSERLFIGRFVDLKTEIPHPEKLASKERCTGPGKGVKDELPGIRETGDNPEASCYGLLPGMKRFLSFSMDHIAENTRGFSHRRFREDENRFVETDCISLMHEGGRLRDLELCDNPVIEEAGIPQDIHNASSRY
jgi:hypothetical protein